MTKGDKKLLKLLKKIDSGYRPTEKETSFLEAQTEWNLFDAPITVLPESIGQLSNLQTLDLRFTPITALPASIGLLSQLQILYLLRTHITKLPESFGQLSNLQTLYLSDTPIITLPESFGQLSQLQSLDLRFTQITKLPESIGLLSNLQELDFSKTPITALPESIGLLSHLQTLHLSNTPITALPESLGQLSNLQALYLGSTQIAELPESIGLLSNLQNLSLWDTQITKLPESFRQLSHLQVLDLENTHITSLPEWLGELPSLRKLDLSGLTLPEIPESLANLNVPFVETNRFWEHDSGINLYQTTLTEQDKSIFLHSPELIPSLYVREEEVPLRECRVLFLGDGGAGKTYTIRRIQNDCRKETPGAPYVTNETPGVAIEDYRTQRDGEDVCIHLWDFGGQAILHSMHRCFLSDQACYVVTVRTRDTDNTPRARFWLRNVTAFAPNAPVVLYINCWDHSDGKRPVDENGLRREFPNIKAVVYVSAKEADDDGFRENLLETILRTATDSAFFRQKVNRKWIAVRNAVIRESKQHHYLTKEAYYALCRDHGIPLEQAPDLLTHFNILGVCFSYHQNNMRQEFADYKLLNPVWLTNAVYSVIEEGTAQAQEGRIKLSSIQQMLVNQAPEQVVFIDENGNRDVRPYKRTMPDIKYKDKECQYIIDVAAAFRLCYRVDSETLFFPALCTNNTPKEALDAPENYPQHIEYLLKYDYLPDSVVHQLMVHCLRADITLNHCWLHGMVLDNMDTHKAIVRMEDDENLKIEIWSKPEHAAYELFTLLRREILIINNRLNLHAVEWIVDGEDRYALIGLLSAAKGTGYVYGPSTGEERRASDLLGLFYKDRALHFTQVHDGKITIPILPREFHRQSKDDQAFRRALYEAYNHICPYCGRVIDSIRDMQVDHILPQKYKDVPELQIYIRNLEELGFDSENPDYVENYLPVHGYCNRDKSDRVELFALLARHERAQAKAKQVLKLYDRFRKEN